MTALAASPVFDLTYELDSDGEIGTFVSVDAHGHLDFRDAEVFLAGTVERELADAGYDLSPTFGLEVEHLWRSEHPAARDDDAMAESWEYFYTSHARQGALPVTRFQLAQPWARPATGPTEPRAERDRRTGEYTVEGVDEWPLVCVHHPDEPAVTGIPEERFVDPTRALDGHVYYCAPCHASFVDRLRIATEKVMAQDRATAFLGATDEDVISVAFGWKLRRDDLERVLTGTDSDGHSRRALTAYAQAYRAAAGTTRRGVVAAAQPWFKVLTVTDIAHLVEDYEPGA